MLSPPFALQRVPPVPPVPPVQTLATAALACGLAPRLPTCAALWCGCAQVALLKRVVSLEGLTDMQLQALVSILVEEKYEDGQHVCEQGAPADSLYIVGEGLVHQVIKKNDGLLGSKSTELTPHAVGAAAPSPRHNPVSPRPLVSTLLTLPPLLTLPWPPLLTSRSAGGRILRRAQPRGRACHVAR